MRDNIRHAITVGECSMVVEAKNHAPQHWYREWEYGIRHGYSIYRLIDTVRNDYYPPIQGVEFWNAFRNRRT